MQARSWLPVAILIACLGPAAQADNAASPELTATLVIVGKTGSHAVEGAEQGIAEARQQGEFLGQQFDLATVDDADVVPATGVSAIMTTGSAEGAAAIAARFPAVPVLNLGAEEDGLRARCIPNLLHVVPSASMRRDAVAQWHKEHPDAEVEALTWHADFEKYAASQLNIRFEKRFKHPMDDAAWAGWAAVKLVTDLVAQTRQAEPVPLLEALRTKLAFDGQKGSTMSFRDNGQLRQPLLIVGGGRILGEAPVRGVADVDDLDSLGDTGCAK